MHLPMDHTPSDRHSDFAPQRSNPARWVKVILSLTLLIGPSMGTVHAAGILDELSPNQQQRIAGICNFEHYERGFNAYRECILGQLAVAKKSTRSVPELATLTLDEQFAVQQTCQSDPMDSPTENLRCIKQQIQALHREPAPDLASLSESERYVLANQCFEQQIDGDAREYRVCRNNAIESLSGLPVADFSQEPDEKRHSISLDCSTTAATVINYRKCLLASLGIEYTADSIADTNPASASNSVESTAMSNIEQQTSAARGSGLVVASLDLSQSRLTQSAPSAALSRQSTDAIELDESDEPTQLAESAAQSVPVEPIEPVEPIAPIAPIAPVEPVEPVKPAVPAESPQLTEISASVSSAPSPEPNSGTALSHLAPTILEDNPPSAQTGTTAQEGTKPLDTPLDTPNDSKDNSGSALQLKLIGIASAISIPLLLLGIWLGRKSDTRQQLHQPAQDFQPIDSDQHVDSDERIVTASPRDPSRHIITVSQDTPGRPDLRPLTPSAHLPEDDHPNLSDTTAFEDALNETYAQPIEPSSLTDPQSALHTAERESAPPIRPSDTAPPQTLPADRNRFASWLSHLPAQTQLEHSIELLIYWMAYADNRYEPALKKEIFIMKDPDAHSLIKRWVFKKDASAFADAVKHLQQNTDLEQRRQIIHLLMALLVNEKALTPNQNVLLRFLSDAFGIGRVKLELSYLKAFGHTMPAMPRPDKSIWWQAYDTEHRLRWNFHSIAQLPEQIQSRIALGQPLQGALHPNALASSYSMAMKRCHHKEVNRLGERESRLLSKQRDKFTMAYDNLLEPVK